MELKTPYLMFLGDAADPLAAKVAFGVKDWRPETILGQMRLPGAAADLGLRELTVREAAEAGAETLVIGVANRGGVIPQTWVAALLEALEAGLDLAAGLHERLADIPALVEASERTGRRLIDVRYPKERYPIGDGAKRPGLRLLTVGTDCSCGKMYTSLAIDRALRDRGLPSDFRATGQTGIFIAHAGVPLDAVVGDFLSGAIETLAPAAAPDHWDVIEGQGALHHPSFAGVTTGLIHGAQPDALVLCHEPTRTHMRGLPHFPIPDMQAAMDLALETARLTNPAARFVGISVNTAKLSDADARAFLDAQAKRFDLPAVDPVRTGVAPIVDALASWETP